MMKRLAAALAIALAATTFVGVGPASAATLFGSDCTATNIEQGAIWISTAHPEGKFPVTAPTSGVLTEWLVNTDIKVESEGKLAGEFPRIFQQRLIVVRAEGPEVFKVVGEALGGALNLHGTNAYLARVPIQQGDYLGLAGAPYAAFCPTGSLTDKFAFTVGGTPVGSSFRVENKEGMQVPVVARIEPDVDGDGYGDETQDKCPQSAAYQTPCPVVTVSSLSLTHPKAVTVYISSSLSAPVAVSATVKVGKDKTVTLRTPGQTVAPGTLGRFNLALPKSVLSTLEALTVKKSLTVTVSASATNVTGSPSTATSKLKLRGEREPAPRKAHRKKAHHKPAKGKHKAPKHH
jgi:hypothetical protein